MTEGIVFQMTVLAAPPTPPADIVFDGGDDRYHVKARLFWENHRAWCEAANRHSEWGEEEELVDYLIWLAWLAHEKLALGYTIVINNGAKEHDICLFDDAVLRTGVDSESKERLSWRKRFFLRLASRRLVDCEFYVRWLTVHAIDAVAEYYSVNRTTAINRMLYVGNEIDLMCGQGYQSYAKRKSNGTVERFSFH